ncbi:unnamed protein product [Discosporangium mesarthrocarpum]
MKVYFLTKKSQTPAYLCQYLGDLAKPANVRLQVLRSGNGGEFISKVFKDVFSRHSITHQFTAPYSTHQIGVAEREWRTLMGMTRCFLSVPGLPKALWPEAVQTAVYIRNRSPSTFLRGRTPFEVWTGRITKLHHF